MVCFYTPPRVSLPEVVELDYYGQKPETKRAGHHELYVCNNVIHVSPLLKSFVAYWKYYRS